MDDLNTAVDLANIAVAANVFLRAKTAAYNPNINDAFNGVSNIAVAARGMLREKQASAPEFGVSDEMAEASVLYDAAKGILRLRNLQQF